VKVKKVLEELNNMPLEADLAIAWYTKEHVEENLDFSIQYLIEKMERKEV